MSLHLIPGFKQSPLHCGPACLKMILHYYGREVSEEEIAEIAKPTFECGTSTENLLLAAEAFGLAGEWHKGGTLEDLRAYTEKDIPVIVEWFSCDASPDPGEPHYSIIIGVSDTQIFILDPEDGQRYEMSHAKFMSVWFSFSGFYIQEQSDVRLRWYLPLTKR